MYLYSEEVIKHLQEGKYDRHNSIKNPQEQTGLQ